MVRSPYPLFAIICIVLLYTHQSFSSSILNSSFILSPSEKAIFQRDVNKRGQALKLIVKRAFPEVRHVRVIVHADRTYLKNNAVDSSQADVEVESSFIPQGGWYKVDVVQSDESNRRIVRSTLNEIGVGDVYLVAGQSNAANWGESVTSASAKTAVMFDPQSSLWQPLKDPQPYTNLGYGSVWPQVIDRVTEVEHIPIGIVNTAIGGTSVEQWLPGAVSDEGLPLFDRLVTAAVELRKLSGYRMILWHQGETNVGTAATYREHFLKLVQDLDAQLGSEKSKWMVSTATFIPPDSDAADCGNPPQPWGGAELKKVQASLPDGITIFPGPDGDDLSSSTYRYAGAVGMCVHFSTAGQREMAYRWFLALNGAAHPIPSAQVK